MVILYCPFYTENGSQINFFMFSVAIFAFFPKRQHLFSCPLSAPPVTALICINIIQFIASVSVSAPVWRLASKISVERSGRLEIYPVTFLRKLCRLLPKSPLSLFIDFVHNFIVLHLF
jgi:hypothetical protein